MVRSGILPSIPVSVLAKFLALLIVVFLTGCIARPKEAVETRTVNPIEAVDPLADNVLIARTEGDDQVHTVLALSSGGADGAYGAGVLTGWTKSGTRPVFDVVTGVSTGALMSVFAFLGEPYDPLLKEVYTTQKRSDVYTKRGIGGLFSQGLFDNDPLKKQIELYVDEETLARVAAQHDLGRRLYVATTNLDAGSLVIWDMGQIAKGNRADRVLHFQKVLRASAAVPGFFDPVYIKPQKGKELRQAHVDGGVKEPVLVSDFMFETPLSDKRLFMLMNSNMRRFNDSRPVKANVQDISQKAISELLRGLTEETIYRNYVLARNVKAQFRITAIPDTFPDATEFLQFDPERMQALFAAGYQAGLQGPESWPQQPERLGQYEQQGQ